MAKKNKNEAFEAYMDEDIDVFGDDVDEAEDYVAETNESEEVDEEPDGDMETEPVIEEEEETPALQEAPSETKDLDFGSRGSNSSDKAKWYVVHTYSGHENKVKVNIEKIVENRGMQDLVLSITVPTEDRVEIKNGQRKVKTRKMFPGYVLVKMIVTNESWYLVRNTQGVTGFVGHGSEPIPLTDDEVRRMGIEKVYIHLDIEPGDSVKVINGPFENFMGVVEEVNMDKQTLKVKISMFGRDTPVELEFGQVDKI